MTTTSPGFTDDRSKLIQVMVWCHQATGHYWSQCWLRSISTYHITRPQWVMSAWPQAQHCEQCFLHVEFRNIIWIWQLMRKTKFYQPQWIVFWCARDLQILWACRLIVNLYSRNKFQRNFHTDTNVSMCEMHLKMSPIKCWPFWACINALISIEILNTCI